MSIETLKGIIRDSDNIVFFGGAGVSTESNIPDFRSEEGLYSGKEDYKYSPEYMLSRSFFNDHTEEFYRFYRDKMVYTDARPNDAHKALAELEKMGKLKAVITQNIDGLHQKAGSKKVLELHGSTLSNYCMDCGMYYGLDYIMESEMLPKCTNCGGLVKPDVVLYEEALNTSVMEEALAYIERADVLIIGGTSLTVYPAAGLIRYYRRNKLILINKAATSYSSDALLSFNSSIGSVLKEAINF